MKTPAMDTRPENEDFQLYQRQQENHLLRKAVILIVLLLVVCSSIVGVGAHVGAHGHDAWYARLIIWVANLILA